MAKEEEILEEENIEPKEDDGEIKLDPEDIFASWRIRENENHKKDKKWFVWAGAIFASLLAFSFYTANFSFAAILIIAAIIILAKNNQDDNIINVQLSHKGVKVGRKFYDLDRLKNFSIIYKPDQEEKALIFEFKNFLHPEMIIPLEDANPLPIRENLLKYLDEDLDKDDTPLSEDLNRLLKL